MVCRHLSALEYELIGAGFIETFRGQAWSSNCREWVYFDVVFDTRSIQKRFDFDPVVKTHINSDPKSGLESGFVCTACNDAIIGLITGDRKFE